MKKIYLLFIFSTLIWFGLPAQSTSGYTFQVNGGLVNPESQLVAALRQFEEVFGYRDGSGLITSNEEVCDCPNYLKDKQASFAAQGGLQFFAQGIDGVIYIREGQVKEGGIQILFAGLGLALEAPAFRPSIFAARGGGAGQFMRSLEGYRWIDLPPGAIGCNGVRYAVDVEILLDPKSLQKLGSNLGTAGATVLTKIDEGIIKLIQNQDQGWPVIKWLNSMGADDASAEVAANILKKAFGELDFTADEFAKLVGDFRELGFSGSKLKNFVDDVVGFDDLITKPNWIHAWDILYGNGSDLFIGFSKNKDYVKIIADYLSNPQSDKALLKSRFLNSPDQNRFITLLLREADDELAYIYSKLGDLKNSARTPLENEDILIDAALGLQSSKKAPFSNLILTEHGPTTDRYLWTLDDRGINLAWEKTPFPTPRGNIVHSNISSKAYIAGEAWFGPNNSVIINAGSGRFGDGAGITSQQWDAAIDFWKRLGYDVTPVPFGKRQLSE